MCTFAQERELGFELSTDFEADKICSFIRHSLLTFTYSVFVIQANRWRCCKIQPYMLWNKSKNIQTFSTKF